MGKAKNDRRKNVSLRQAKEVRNVERRWGIELGLETSALANTGMRNDFTVALLRVFIRCLINFYDSITRAWRC
jgi:hypothetical protein